MKLLTNAQCACIEQYISCYQRWMTMTDPTQHYSNDNSANNFCPFLNWNLTGHCELTIRRKKK